MKQYTTKGWFKSLTPKKAWDQYVGTSVEMFISNFRDDGVHDIETACKIYASEIPLDVQHLFTQDQIELIAKLLTRYAKKYIAKKDGICKLKLYTTEELEAIFYADWETIEKNLKKYIKR